MSDDDHDELTWLPGGTAMRELIEQWRQQRQGQMNAVVSGSAQVHGALSVRAGDAIDITDSLAVEVQTPEIITYPDVLIQAAVVHLGDSHDRRPDHFGCLRCV